LSAPLLTARDLACIRAGRPVFARLSFALAAGEVLLLRGPNGSGKSSLLRILAGFLRPALGRLAWAGTTIESDAPDHRPRLHYVGHADPIKGALTARENLAFAVAVSGGRAGAVDQALAGFDLTRLADLPARYLSAGQRRRLSLARLLAADRPLWLLDEPGVGLDLANRARLEGVVAAHRAAGGIAVIASHGDVAIAGARVLELAAG
jgi:heme exporter protein A